MSPGAAAGWAALRRPHQAPVVTTSLGHGVVREGEATTWRVTVDDPEGRVEDVAAVLDAPVWIERRPTGGQVATSLPDDGSAPLAVSVRPVRWGRRTLGEVLVVASSAWAGFRWVRHTGGDEATLVALPVPARFDATAPPVQTAGLVGVNPSPRQSSGTEFASIRPFQPGDRLRRIHWPQSLRTGTLHVTSTWADHDRSVVLLVDALDDVGDSEGIGGRASSLDIAVRAAGAIAAHHIGIGDRVALVALGSRGIQRLPPSTGNRHLRRLLEVLATLEADSRRSDTGQVPPGLGPGALVVLLSPLVTAAALQRAVTMADHGLTVLVVDCLPPDIAEHDGGDPYVGIMWRIRLLQREHEIRRVSEAGIAVVPWRGPGSLDPALRDLHRHTRVRLGARA
jgi:uncharacterized protein (DUF58 family)